MAEASPTLECGFCLRQNVASSDSKTLPCSHVHCLECLTGYFEINNILKCPVQECGEVFDDPPDALLSYDVKEDDIKLCDVCVKEKMFKQAAIMYCTVCSRTFCIKHLESHDVTMDDHAKMGLDEYEAQDKNGQSRNCTKHEGQPYTTGCRICLAIACPDCIPDMIDCNDDGSHDLLPLNQLVQILLDKDIGSSLLCDGEEQFETLFKETSKVRSEHDSKTTEMVQLIHQTRDAQSKDSDKLKYKKLEDELLEKRQKSSADIAEFMENIVFEKWTRLRNYILQVDSRATYNQADFVKRFPELKEGMKKFDDEELPRLKLTDVVQLRQKGNELEMVPSTSIALNIPPQMMILMRSVDLSSDIRCGCMYKGCSYLVTFGDTTITRIDSSYEIQQSFISCPKGIESIVVHQDRIYTLTLSDPKLVIVYDLSGGHVTSWNHPCCLPTNRNMLTAVGDQLLITERVGKKITVYSFTGSPLPDITGPALDSGIGSICAVDNVSVIICQWYGHALYRFNIATREVMWTSSPSWLSKPQLALCHGGQILVTEKMVHFDATIEVRSIITGEKVSHLELDRCCLRGDSIGLGVCGTTLLECQKSTAHFYRLSVSPPTTGTVHHNCQPRTLQ